MTTRLVLGKLLGWIIKVLKMAGRLAEAVSQKNQKVRKIVFLWFTLKLTLYS